MIYEIQMQYIPGNDQIWVARLNPEDPVYQYTDYGEAVIKMEELKVKDPTGREYRIVEV